MTVLDWRGEGTDLRARVVEMLREAVPEASLEQLRATTDEMFAAIGAATKELVVAALAQERATMREREERLWEGLEVYGTHLHDCPWTAPGWACTCGYDALMADREGAPPASGA